jgi:TolB protein
MGSGKSTKFEVSAVRIFSTSSGISVTKLIGCTEQSAIRSPFSPRANLRLVLVMLGSLLLAGNSARQSPSRLGIFEKSGDVGDTPRQGSTQFDPATGEYRITGGGANIWSTVDAFQFVWTRVSGDVSLSADVRFVGRGAMEHRKAVLMLRESLDPDAAYADVALHGNGLISLQYRSAKGAETFELRSNASAHAHLRIVRHGNQFTTYAARPGEPPVATGPVTVDLADPVYLGLGVSSHDAKVLETAVFSNVEIAKLTSFSQTRNPTNVRSAISVYDLKSKMTRVVYRADRLWEAPNWSPNGKYLLANSGGMLYRLAFDERGQATPEKLDLDSAYRTNNDHGISHDGKLLAFSAETASSHGSEVFVASLDDLKPRLLVPLVPSYFHGWSPDDRWLALVGERHGVFNIFRVAVRGGSEQRLTSRAAYDDGPDYSPDGQWIYMNSNRSGSWKIWRIPASGAGPFDAKAQRITSGDWEDWFPHPSPDGQWLVFLSFPKGTPSHDVKTQVELRMMRLPSSDAQAAQAESIEVLSSFFGGQGTINVNSWSPDSKKFAFVSYTPSPP